MIIIYRCLSVCDRVSLGVSYSIDIVVWLCMHMFSALLSYKFRQTHKISNLYIGKIPYFAIANQFPITFEEGCKMWCEITYTFQNFNGAAVEVLGMDD